MGDLSEWIRVHRRADVPAPSAQATNPTDEAPVPTPVPDPGQPLAVLLPTVETMRSTGIPLIVLAVFGGAATLVVLGAVRQFRRARRSG
jgi:hypothetical protein